MLEEKRKMIRARGGGGGFVDNEGRAIKGDEKERGCTGLDAEIGESSTDEQAVRCVNGVRILRSVGENVYNSSTVILFIKNIANCSR